MNTQRTTTTKPNSFTLFLSTTRLFFFLQILLFNCTTWIEDARHSSSCATTFFLKFFISSAFALGSSINEATFSFSSSFSRTYQTNSLPSANTLLPAPVSPIHWKNLQELVSYITIPIKQVTQKNKTQNKTQNRHLLTFLCKHLQNLLPGRFTLRDVNIITSTSHLHFTKVGDEDDNEDPSFPFILSPINQNTLRVWNSQEPPLGFKIYNNNQRHRGFENGSQPFFNLIFLNN